MNKYVKLGVGWTLCKENGYIYLTNVLEQKLFSISNECYKEIIELIANCASINQLETYGEIWSKFKHILESNYVIYYSDNNRIIQDNLDFGAKIAASSSFVIRPPQVSRLTIQINNKCNLSCSMCNELVCFPCVSCSSHEPSISISLDIVKEAIEFLFNFGNPELYLIGGDPLLDLPLLKSIISIYNEYSPYKKVRVITNGVELLHIDENKLRYLSNMTTFIIVVTQKNIRHLKELINIMTKNNILYEIQSKNVPHYLLNGVFHNDTVSFKKMNGKRIIEIDNIKLPANLYTNTVKNIRNQCYDGMLYMDVEGNVSVCKGYIEKFKILNDKAWNAKLHELSKAWKKSPKGLMCTECGLNSVCLSCQLIKEMHLNDEISNTQTICFTGRTNPEVI